MATAVQLAGIYELDPAHSTIEFAVRHVGVSTFRASFADIAAELKTEDGQAILEGRALVESISIGEPKEFRDHVLHGGDFFDAHEHPTITFHSTSVELKDDGHVTVTGELVISGVTRWIAAHGSYYGPTEDPFGGSRIGFDLRTTVDRREWGMSWQTPLPGGGDAVGWEVDISAQLELVRQDGCESSA